MVNWYTNVKWVLEHRLFAKRSWPRICTRRWRTGRSADTLASEKHAAFCLLAVIVTSHHAHSLTLISLSLAALTLPTSTHATGHATGCTSCCIQLCGADHLRHFHHNAYFFIMCTIWPRQVFFSPSSGPCFLPLPPEVVHLLLPLPLWDFFVGHFCGMFNSRRCCQMMLSHGPLDHAPRDSLPLTITAVTLAPFRDTNVVLDARDS